ncbi:MAG: hypothetical protein QOE92_1063 [Chloroflexota bacterium]|nr:hypothetical protein [Chloroflexota bacterium]
MDGEALAPSRTSSTIGAVIVIAAVGVHLALAQLPVPLMAGEAALVLVAGLYAFVLVRFQAQMLVSRTSTQVLGTTVGVAVVTAIVAVGAGYFPDPLGLAAVLFLIMVVGSILSADEVELSTDRPMVTLLAAGFGFAAVCGSAEAQGIHLGLQGVAWGGLLLGVGVLFHAYWRFGVARQDSRLRQLTAVARASARLGRTTDLREVSTAVLEAFAETYPHLNWGGVLLWNPSSRTLVAVDVALTPGGVVSVAGSDMPAVEIKPGEGLAGLAYQAGEIATRSTAAEVAEDTMDRPAANRAAIEKGIGVVQSAIAAPLRDSNGLVVGVVSLGSTEGEYHWHAGDELVAQGMADVASVALERGRLYEEQRRRAHTDDLTGLPNRREFERILREGGREHHFSILAIDLDNLKMINDEHGHEAGDAILRLVSRYLRAGLRAEDSLARVGGDEFVAILPATEETVALEIAQRLTSTMNGVAVPFGAARISSGCASGGPGADPREVWNLADEALYRAKAEGRNRVELARVWSSASNEKHQRWGELIPRMLEKRQMGSVYQPIIRLSDDTTVAFEALARPQGMGPEASVEGLFAAALRLGLTRDLDWLCRRAAVDGARDMPDGVALFVNVGVPALLDPLHDVDQMLLLLQWAGREPYDVVLELSEREAVTDSGRFREVIDTYRDAGFRFALDDVGEGHSTIEVLASGQPEYIKVARSLTQGSSARGHMAAIEALATFARASGAVLIAEGVETPEQRERMAELGVELGQGYGLGRPQHGLAIEPRHEPPKLAVV